MCSRTHYEREQKGKKGTKKVTMDIEYIRFVLKYLKIWVTFLFLPFMKFLNISKQLFWTLYEIWTLYEPYMKLLGKNEQATGVEQSLQAGSCLTKGKAKYTRTCCHVRRKYTNTLIFEDLNFLLKYDLIHFSFKIGLPYLFYFLK